jgi:type I restriction enzyme, S subunit
MLKENDIVISTVGSWPNNPDSVVGKVIKVSMLADESLLNQNAVRLRSIDKCSQLFLYNSIAKEEFSEHVISGAQGSANQASVTLEHIFCFKIVYSRSSFW